MQNSSSHHSLSSLSSTTQRSGGKALPPMSKFYYGPAQTRTSSNSGGKQIVIFASGQLFTIFQLHLRPPSATHPQPLHPFNQRRPPIPLTPSRRTHQRHGNYLVLHLQLRHLVKSFSHHTIPAHMGQCLEHARHPSISASTKVACL